MIEEHNRELLTLNMKFGDTLLEAVSFLQESDAFLEKVKVGRRISEGVGIGVCLCIELIIEKKLRVSELQGCGIVCVCMFI